MILPILFLLTVLSYPALLLSMENNNLSVDVPIYDETTVSEDENEGINNLPPVALMLPCVNQKPTVSASVGLISAIQKVQGGGALTRPRVAHRQPRAPYSSKNRNLHRAVHNGDLSSVDELLKKGADVNYLWRIRSTPLILVALLEGHTAVFKRLLAEPSLKANLHELLEKASLHKKDDIVQHIRSLPNFLPKQSSYRLIAPKPLPR